MISNRCCHVIVTATLLGLIMPLKADILFNELYIDPPGSDGDANLEYIELISTTGGVESTDDHTLLVIDSNNGGYGKIRHRWSLNGLQTGKNGLLLLGNLFTSSLPYTVPTETALADPSSPDAMNNGDLGSNGGFTILLVRGFSPTTARDTDLDSNDSGTLTFTPWTAMVDSVGFDDTDPLDPPNRDTYALANVSQQGYFPENISRIPENVTPNSADAWFGGTISSSDPNLAYDLDESFGGYPGAGATPGRPNIPPPLAELRLNEVSINPNGNDENLEFIEIVSVSGERERADGYHVILISNEPASADRGTIVEAWDLSGLNTGENGLLVIGDHYLKPIAGKRPTTPFKSLVEVETEAGDPASFGRNDIGPSQGISILLVRGFTGVSGMDLDMANNGSLSVAPWDAIMDSIGFDHQNEITGTLTATYALGKLPTKDFYPDNMSRLAGDLRPNNGDAWYGGDYGGDSQGSIAFGSNRFVPDGVTLRVPRATPGGRNLSPKDTSIERDIVINEVLIDAPPSPGNSDDHTYEFIELISTQGRAEPLEGLTLLVVDTAADSAQLGVIQQVLDLSGLSTGVNGICLLGDSYNDLLLDAEIPFDTNREDPQGLNAGDLSPNDGLTILLVEDFTGRIREDLDANNDGIFDLTPWGHVVDGVGFGAIADPSVAVVSQEGFMPDTLARLPQSLRADIRHDASAWAGALLGGMPANAEYADSAYFGPFKGGITPGYANHAAAPAEEGTVLINEVIINPGGGSVDECIEIIVSSLDARSLSGYSLILLDSAGGSVGEIQHIWDLSGLATGDNGLLLIGDDYAVGAPFEVDEMTALGSPIGMYSGHLSESGDRALSLLLVKGLRPTVNEGTDLDAHPTVGDDDDGVLDLQPWTMIADSVGYREYDGDRSVNVGITYGAADLTQSFEPDAVARVASVNHLNVGQSNDWYGGDFVGGTTSARFGYDQSQIFGSVNGLVSTPGFHNAGEGFTNLDDTDADRDGRSWLLEFATGTDPETTDAPVPIVVERLATGETTLSYQRRSGGSLSPSGIYAVQGVHYAIESSPNLEQWTPVAELPGLESVAGEDAGLECVTVPLGGADPGQARYVRLRIYRSME